ncbi:MATH and LRR domain-containing protein PFE0570w-like [Rhopalosiphum padi]|uniref:MATH and LRR domain-containing protein PFE0570w-like n=1 Tax=Rhopalosiphum padi TaxID=40932 RepID=UPI00298E54E7|nr:MATH and LRR domain-containing protein PFE0570w-like [Rhopalosiphum padi]
MSPSNSKLSLSCESTSCIQNENGKRTFLTSINDVFDDEIYYKRKKSIKHSQVDINNAVLSSNGYMTRNKLKKQLTNNSESIESTAKEHKSSRINNIRSKRGNACKNRKPSKQICKKKLQPGYIFTNDISYVYPGKQLDTEYKKSIPSLFESDSDSEIDNFQLNYIKNDVKEISTCTSDPDNVYSIFNKNVEMRTYFNKKSYFSNNKSNINSLNTFEESNQEPSRLSNIVKMVNGSNLCKSISQNNSTTNKSLKGTGSSTKEYVQTNTEDDEIIIVTESFIRQLNNEDQIIKTESQEQHKENEVVSKILSTDYGWNKNNMCTVDTNNIDNICNINYDSSICSDLLLKQNVDVINESDKCTPSPFKTNIVENSLMSIFDEPEENILVESYTNINDSLINYSDFNSSTSISEKMIELSSLQTFEFDNSNSVLDRSIENHQTSENVFKENNVTCHLPLDQIGSNSITNQYFHTVIKDEIKIKSDSFSSKINNICLLNNDNLSSTKDNYSKTNKNLGSKCYCKNFSSFNNNYNKIFNSKIKHFAFNNNAKKVRQKILHQKHIEANILKILITQEHKNNIQSKEHIPIFDSISINKKYEKYINLKENDHIKPNILSMLKDVYVDVEYLTEYCDYNTSDNKLPEPQKDIKFNIQPSKAKSVDNMIMFKNNSASTSNNTTKNKQINLKPFHEKDDNSNKKDIVDNISTSNSSTKKYPIHLNPCDENDVNSNNKNEIIDNVSMSKSKPVNDKLCEQNYIPCNKNEIVDNAITSNNTTNKSINTKLYSENYVNLNKNKIIDNVSSLNTTMQNNLVNCKPCDESYVYFNKNKIIDDANISNSTTKNKPIHFENNVNLNKNKIFDYVSISKGKPVKDKLKQNYIHHSKIKIVDNASMSNNTIKNNSTGIKPYDKNDVNFNRNKITVSTSISNSLTKNKSFNHESYYENGVNFNKNEINYATTIKKNYFDFNSHSNSPVVNAKIDSKSKIKVEDNFNYETADIKYDLKTEKCSGLQMKPFDICNLSDNTVLIKENNDSKEEFTMDEVKNNIQSENILSSANININHGLTQTKIIHILKDKNKPVPALIENEKETNILKIFEPPQYKNHFDTTDTSETISSKADQIFPALIENEKETNVLKIFEPPQCKDHFDTTDTSETISSKADQIFPALIENEKETNILKIFEPPQCKDHFDTTNTSETISSKADQIFPALIENEKETNILKIFEPPQYKNNFDTTDTSETISSKADQTCPMLPHISENNEPINHLFDLPADDNSFSLNIINSNDDFDDDDDDDRLLIEDFEQNVDGNVSENSTSILKLANIANNERTINCLSSAANSTTEIKLCENKLINPKKKQFSEINSIKNEKGIVFHLSIIMSKKKCDQSNNYENASLLKKDNNSLDDCISIEKCNEFYKIKSLNKNTVNKNESLPRNIKDILKEMYVDELFISTCQHMNDFYNDDQLKNDLFFHNDEYQNTKTEKLDSDIIKENDLKNIHPELRQSNSTKKKTILKSEINDCNQQKAHIKPTIKTQKSNSLQNPKNVKSNMKIRIHLREFILSNKPLNVILESKEFRNLRFFSEEEIAGSIGVFIFEQSICPPIITGLSVYKENYEQLKNEEKNKILASTNLNISCPEIMKLTSITLALVKMLRSDTLIETILNVIRKNVLTKQMNTNHKIDDQLIKQTVYFVDICVRTRMLKTLQIFIFDSMVFLPNKYCCTIFISLLLWKNCLPRSINNEEDPVIITAISYLIAKTKFYSEETIGCDIFQRELINLLSCHFNYTFTIDIPTNFIQHKHKPDFFVSVVMFLKCCNPKDLVEFMINCLFPMIDNYLNTQQNEMYAIKTMESINMTMKPFKMTCNTTVATYLKKCKDPINGAKKNGKEHIYNTTYNSYKILQNKFIEYLNDSRPRSQCFEESLMSIILMFGSVDYLTSCLSLMQWKPKFELSAILSEKIVIFKSILGHVWDNLCAIDDIKTLKCMINSCLLNKDVYHTIVQLHNLR